MPPFQVSHSIRTSVCSRKWYMIQFRSRTAQRGAPRQGRLLVDAHKTEQMPDCFVRLTCETELSQWLRPSFFLYFLAVSSLNDSHYISIYLIFFFLLVSSLGTLVALESTSIQWRIVCVCSCWYIAIHLPIVLMGLIKIYRFRGM